MQPLQILPRVTRELVQARLSEYLEDLEVSEDAQGIVVTLKGYLGWDKFVSITAIIEELGGKYISTDKASLFIVPKEKEEHVYSRGSLR